MGLTPNEDPKAQPKSAPDNTTPPDEQADPKLNVPPAIEPGKQPAGSGTSAVPSTVPPPGAHAANLREAEASARDKQAHERDERAANRGLLKKTHAEGLAVAHDNLGKEIDAVIASMGQGNAVTLAQMQALRAAVVGCHGVAHALAEGRIGFDDDAA